MNRRNVALESEGRCSRTSPEKAVRLSFLKLETRRDDVHIVCAGLYRLFIILHPRARVYIYFSRYKPVQPVHSYTHFDCMLTVN